MAKSTTQFTNNLLKKGAAIKFPTTESEIEKAEKELRSVVLEQDGTQINGLGYFLRLGKNPSLEALNNLIQQSEKIRERKCLEISS